MFAEGNRDRGKLSAGSTKARKIFLRDQRRSCTRRGHTVDRIFSVSSPTLPCSFAVPLAAHHWSTKAGKANRRNTGNRMRQASVHCHSRPLNATGGETPMCPGLVVHSQFESQR